MTPPLPPDVEPCPPPVYSPPLWVWLLAAALWLAPIGAGYALATWQCEAGR